MIALLSILLVVLVSPFRSNSSVLAENALLRHQVMVLRRKVKGRIPLTNGDRCLCSSTAGFRRSSAPWF